MAVSADNFSTNRNHVFQIAEIKRQTAANCVGGTADVIAEAFLTGGKSP